LTQLQVSPYNRRLSLAFGGSMYAVIRSGGKQYRVEPGATIEVERLEGKVGGKITFDEILAVRTDEKKMLTGDAAGKAKITGTIVRHLRAPKVKIMKYKRGGQYQILRGHRQGLTAVQVSEIQLS
jgi:large subunit ribosomal protein L21